MKYIYQFARILAVCFAGEVLAKILPLPVPASVYGLVLLLVLLCTGVLKKEQVADCAKFLVAVMPMMFVPAVAGVMDLTGEIGAMFIPFVLACLPGTMVILGAGGFAAQKMIDRKRGADHV